MWVAGSETVRRDVEHHHDYDWCFRIGASALRDLRNAYRRLLERATGVDLLQPGGLTPREAEVSLQKAFGDDADEGRIAELTTLLERCAYADRGSDSDRERGLQICAALEQLIPTERAKRRSLSMRIPSSLAPIILVALLIAFVVFAISRIDFSFGRVGGSVKPSVATDVRTDWQARQTSELDVVEQFSGDWATPSRDVTWHQMRIPEILQDRPRNTLGSVGLDIDTGTDGTYENADDPFRPPLNWTHRMYVFDFVNGRYEFVSTPANSAFGEGPSLQDREEFVVVVTVDPRPGRPVPVPTPAPDSWVTEFTTSPRVRSTFYRDTHGQLYFTAQARGRVKLQYTVSGRRDDYDNTPLPAVSFEAEPANLPANVAADAAVVIDAIGGIPALTYENTVRRLHSYFAGFAVAPIDQSEQRANEYLTVALARKGVCRHRARAFFITANAAGVRTRLVENRCHSFCEVLLPDGNWRRLEFRLGNEEGPPGLQLAQLTGMSPLNRAGTLTIFLFVLIPFAGFAMLCLAGLRSRDRRLYFAGSQANRQDRWLQRAIRDERFGRSTVSLQLRERILAEFGELESDTPANIEQRLRDLRATSQCGDAFELQRTFWNCRNIMRWFNGRGMY